MRSKARPFSQPQYEPEWMRVKLDQFVEELDKAQTPEATRKIVARIWEDGYDTGLGSAEAEA